MTSHSEIAQAFDAEHRQHTFVEAVKSGDDVVHIKRYELRLSLEELLCALDALSTMGTMTIGHTSPSLAARQLRGKILGTLGLVEEG